MRQHQGKPTAKRSGWKRRASSVLASLARRLYPPASEAMADPTTLQEGLAILAGIMPIRVLLLDTKLRVLAANRSSFANQGDEDLVFLGRSIFDIDPEYFGPFAAQAQRCLQGESITTPRLRARGGDGNVWLRNQVGPWRHADGTIGGLISVSVEITDVVEALSIAERSEERLNLAMELAELHVWELDYKTGKVFTGGARENFFDGSLDEADIARDTNITIHPDDRERVAAEWRDAAETNTPVRPQYRINRQDGKEVWVACTVSLVCDEAGGPLRLVGAMQNITAQKQAEAALIQAKEHAEEANRAKSTFLATMSHEIRTPLNGVLGMAQAMSADELSTVQRERLDTIRDSGETLLSVLNDVLDISKIEAGKLELEAIDFDVSRLAQDVVDTFAGVAAGKSLPLTLQVADAARGRYRGDAGRMRQILANLVSNSLKFTDVGKVDMSVERRGDSVAFVVSDTGIGIPVERIEGLFDKFEQVDASTTRRFGGTGLGLAISRRLATLMDARILVTSEEGVGSRFEFVVPLTRIGAEAGAAKPSESIEGQSSESSTLRLLAAEDNRVNQLVLRTLLQQAGVEPRIVSNGAEAIAAWQEQEWDVILMDIQMPVMDGVAAARIIREAEHATGRRRTPIVALTANAMTHQRAEYVQAGMDGLVAKPIRIQDLLDALQRALEGADPQGGVGDLKCPDLHQGDDAAVAASGPRREDNVDGLQGRVHERS